MLALKCIWNDIKVEESPVESRGNIKKKRTADSRGWKSSSCTEYTLHNGVEAGDANNHISAGTVALF